MENTLRSQSFGFGFLQSFSKMKFNKVRTEIHIVGDETGLTIRMDGVNAQTVLVISLVFLAR